MAAMRPARTAPPGQRALADRPSLALRLAPGCSLEDSAVAPRTSAAAPTANNRRAQLMHSALCQKLVSERRRLAERQQRGMKSRAGLLAAASGSQTERSAHGSPTTAHEAAPADICTLFFRSSTGTLANSRAPPRPAAAGPHLRHCSLRLLLLPLAHRQFASPTWPPAQRCCWPPWRCWPPPPRRERPQSAVCLSFRRASPHFLAAPPTVRISARNWAIRAAMGCNGLRSCAGGAGAGGGCCRQQPPLAARRAQRRLPLARAVLAAAYF